MSDLDAIFANKVESAPAAPEVEPTTTAEPEPEPVKAEEKPEPEKVDKDEPEQEWTKKAALDERRKRQEKERELESIRKELEELRNKQFGKKDEYPDMFDDPKAFERRVKSDIDQKMSQVRAEMSRNMMMQMHEDYEEAEIKFFDLVKEHPMLGQQVVKHDHPAKFVYEQVKKFEEFKQIQDGSLKEKLRAEIRSELEKEFKQSQEKKASKVANLSRSLATESSSDSAESTSITRIDQLFAR